MNIHLVAKPAFALVDAVGGGEDGGAAGSVGGGGRELQAAEDGDGGRQEGVIRLVKTFMRCSVVLFEWLPTQGDVSTFARSKVIEARNYFVWLFCDATVSTP